MWFLSNSFHASSLFLCCTLSLANARSFFDYRTNEPSKQPLGLEVTYSKKKISVKRSKGVKSEAKDSHKTYQEEKMRGK